MNRTSALPFIEAIYGALTAADRIAPERIEQAERRLGVRLPATLRCLYEQTGASSRVHQAHNHLVALEAIDFAGEHLVFYEENQAVVVWGIARARLADEDPPVEQGQHDRHEDAWSFYPEFESVSDFARAQAAWQAVQGALPFVGVVECDAADGPRFDATLDPPALETVGLRAWLVDEGVAVDAGGTLFGLAARSARAFEAACSRVGFRVEQWDYATLRDE